MYEFNQVKSACLISHALGSDLFQLRVEAEEERVKMWLEIINAPFKIEKRENRQFIFGRIKNPQITNEQIAAQKIANIVKNMGIKRFTVSVDISSLNGMFISYWLSLYHMMQLKVTTIDHDHFRIEPDETIEWPREYVEKHGPFTQELV